MQENCLNILTWLHRQGFTPFAWHTVETRRWKEEHPHIIATYATLLAIPMLAVYLAQPKFCAMISVPFIHLNRLERQAIAATGLVIIAATVGVLAGSAHGAIDFFGGVIKNAINKHFEQNNKVGLEDDTESEMEERVPSVIVNINNTDESSGLLGRDKNDALICRIGKYHPLRLVYPPTPYKTAAWIPAMMLLAFAAAHAVNSDLFNQYAAVSPVGNNFSCFVNCNSTLTNSTGCVFVLGYGLGMTLSIGVSMAVAGIAATLFYYKAPEVCRNLAREASIRFVRET